MKVAGEGWAARMTGCVEPRAQMWTDDERRRRREEGGRRPRANTKEKKDMVHISM